MANFRFYRRFGIFPGLTVNVTHRGPSLTVGVRGAHVTVGRGGVRRTVGIPGTGAYFTSLEGYHTGVHTAHVEEPALANLAREATFVLVYAASLAASAVVLVTMFLFLLWVFGVGR